MIGDIGRFLAERIWYATYTCNGSEYQTSVTVNADGQGHIDAMFEIDATLTGGGIVTKVKLFDRNDDLWVSADTALDSSLSGDGLLYQFRITIDVA